MRSNLSLPKLVFGLSKLCYYISLGLAVFVFIFSCFSFLESDLNINIPLLEIQETTSGNRARIDIPFIGLHIGFSQSILMVYMWLFFVFYAIYFFFLSRFFAVFSTSNSFTKQSLKDLRIFGLLNGVPFVFALIATLIDLARGITFKMDSEYLLVPIHLFVGLIVYLVLTLVQKGTVLQQENDLTI